MTVRERYRYPSIREALGRILQGNCVEFERYNPLTRDRDGEKGSLTLGDGEVLIVDGVVGLDIPEVRDVSSVRIYTESDESVRRTRVREFYALKGLSEEEIDVLQQLRRLDEEPLIVATKEFADCVVDLGDPT